MEAISLFMLAIALSLGITFFYSFIFGKNKAETAYFQSPTRSTFNIVWGFLFYLGYAMMIAPNESLMITFIILFMVNIVYILYIHILDRFLNSLKTPVFDWFIKKIINSLTNKQKKTDEKIGLKYNAKKSAKILGITGYQLKLSGLEDLVEKKYNMLKMLCDDGKIKNPYFLEMIKKAKAAIL